MCFKFQAHNLFPGWVCRYAIVSACPEMDGDGEKLNRKTFQIFRREFSIRLVACAQ
jgi:hypothetical protein